MALRALVFAPKLFTAGYAGALQFRNTAAPTKVPALAAYQSGEWRHSPAPVCNLNPKWRGSLLSDAAASSVVASVIPSKEHISNRTPEVETPYERTGPHYDRAGLHGSGNRKLPVCYSLIPAQNSLKHESPLNRHAASRRRNVPSAVGRPSVGRTRRTIEFRKNLQDSAKQIVSVFHEETVVEMLSSSIVISARGGYCRS